MGDAADSDHATTGAAVFFHALRRWQGGQRGAARQRGGVAAARRRGGAAAARRGGAAVHEKKRRGATRHGAGLAAASSGHQNMTFMKPARRYRGATMTTHAEQLCAIKQSKQCMHTRTKNKMPAADEGGRGIVAHSNYSCGSARPGSAPSTSTRPRCGAASEACVGSSRRTLATHSGK